MYKWRKVSVESRFVDTRPSRTSVVVVISGMSGVWLWSLSNAMVSLMCSAEAAQDKASFPMLALC